jgi:hypothetical protein
VFLAVESSGSIAPKNHGAGGGTAARHGIRVATLLVALALAPACTRPIIYTTPDTGGGRWAPALIAARAVVGRYHLVATGASNPSQERSLCSAPYYEVREDASFVELVPGSYDLGADVSPAVARTFVGFGVRGRVIVEAAHCYSPAILCQREVDLDWEQTCRLVLEPRSCASPWFERRVLMRSFEDC